MQSIGHHWLSSTGRYSTLSAEAALPSGVDGGGSFSEHALKRKQGSAIGQLIASKSRDIILLVETSGGS
jgi:hypothetical protein